MKASYVWATLKQAVGQTPLYFHRTTPIEDPGPLRYLFFALVKPPLQFSVSSLASSVSKLRPKKIRLHLFSIIGRRVLDSVPGSMYAIRIRR
jgi:hypothetical protein